VPSAARPDLTRFLDIVDIVHTLERIGAPYMIIGGFAVTASPEANGPSAGMDEGHLSAQAAGLGPEVAEKWEPIRSSARAAAGRERETSRSRQTGSPSASGELDFAKSTRW
jgi:hypothetical protein